MNNSRNDNISRKNTNKSSKSTKSFKRQLESQKYDMYFQDQFYDKAAQEDKMSVRKQISVKQLQNPDSGTGTSNVQIPVISKEMMQIAQERQRKDLRMKNYMSQQRINNSGAFFHPPQIQQELKKEINKMDCYQLNEPSINEESYTARQRRSLPRIEKRTTSTQRYRSIKDQIAS